MARSRNYMPVTKDSTKLLIGLMQVRVSDLYPHTSATASRTAAIPQQSTMAVTVEAGGTYSGSRAGAFIVEIESGGSTFKWTDVGGTVTTGVSLSTSPVTLEEGITVDFSAATGATVGNKWVIGVQPAGTSTATQTSILSPYSILDYNDSLGAVQAAQITADISVKDHSSGYPAQKDLVITEASNIAVEVTLEEIGSTATNPIFTAMLDAINTGQVYACAVEGVGQFSNGDLISFWLPNCNLVPNFSFAPGNDWAGVPIKFEAVSQNSLEVSTSLIYRNSFSG